MTAKELQRIFQKGECLSLDTLRTYNEGKLNKKSMHEVEKHLLECGLCAGAVDGLNQKRLTEVNKLTEHIQRRLAVYMNTPPRISFFRRFGGLIITALILLIGSCSWWLFSHDKNVPSSNFSNSKSTEIIQNNNAGTEENNSQVLAEQSQKDPVSITGNASDANTGKNKVSSPIVQNLPADLPGKDNALTVGQPVQVQTDSKTSNGNSPDDDLGPNSRTANVNQPIRIKSVLVYPPVTLNDKSTRKQSKDGQLGQADNSGASFEIDQMPTYPGGDNALQSFIMSNFKSISIDRSQITRYATGVMFVVNAKTGAVSSPELSFSISPEIDAELLRVINSQPAWNPGKKRGEVQIMVGITLE